ncbi:NADH-quinone oxidoreductase subunit NuoE [Nakamurella sp. YIM 132087]|uniref:NADH-quinone oxidoreductase subunit NuoE n=1 Tax=Nakamurella alba TaxID=2665158 RepID=A0A7K1FK36_9ACTN|nr:NADH-quinone oxidoreductase subunit NuoE [Nakamurella alba]MTD14468.1 NADH-quinone oxidoreductase subunit NuoE [Nakamurella alba]
MNRIGVPEFVAGTTDFDETTRARADALVARYPVGRSALLPLLHLVQSVEGCVTQGGIEFCARQLDLTAAEVSAVATFYTMYKRRPCGEHLVSVCTNTLCAVLGGDEIYAALSDHLGVGHEETAGEPGEPGSITLETAECLAACDHGPVLQVNYEFYDRQTADGALGLVQALQRGEKPAPTRGAPLTDFRTAELEIAGVVPADEAARVAGNSVSEYTLRGNTIAEATGASAPAMPDHYDMPALPEKK